MLVPPCCQSASNANEAPAAACTGTCQCIRPVQLHLHLPQQYCYGYHRMAARDVCTAAVHLESPVMQSCVCAYCPSC